MTVRRTARRGLKRKQRKALAPPPLTPLEPAPRGGERSPDDRAELRTLEYIAAEKQRFIDWLDGNGCNVEKLGEATKRLLSSRDPRVRTRIVEFNAKVRGWMDDEDKKAGPAVINISIGVVPPAKPIEPKVVEAVTVPPITNGYVGNGTQNGHVGNGVAK